MCSPRFHLFSLSTWGWTSRKPYRIKHRCFCEHLEEHFGSPWEHDGNTLGTRRKNQKSVSPCPLKKKKTGLFMSACWAFPLAAWNFSLQNCSSPFSPRLMAGAEFWGHSFSVHSSMLPTLSILGGSLDFCDGK